MERSLPRRLATILTLLLPLACRTATPQRTDATAFIGINVLAMTDPVEIATDQTVVVQGGIIVAVGDRRRVRVPVGASRIVGAGKFLMPGLVDAHVHLEHFSAPDLLQLFLAHGVTTVRNMDGRPHVLAWREAVGAGRLIGPQIVTTGPVLDGVPPLLPDNTAVPFPEAGRAAVRAHASAGYDAIKVYTNVSTDVYAAIVEEARNLGMPVVGHVPRAVPIEIASGAQLTIEHLSDLARESEAHDSPHRGKWHWSKLLSAAPIDAAKLRGVSQVLAANGTTVVPALVQTSRSVATTAEIRAWSAAPEVALVPRQWLEEWAARARRASERLDEDDWTTIQRGAKQRAAIVRALRDAGVRLLVGTDTPNPFVVPGASVHEELREFVAAGIPIAEALVAATRAPCELLRQKCGVIASGNRADLLVLAANPLTHAGHLQPELVFAGGRALTPEQLLSGVRPNAR